MASVQFKISISEELLARLEAAKQKFKKRTTNIIASKIIEDYLELWEEAERVRKKKVIKQYVKARKQHDPPDEKQTDEKQSDGSDED